MLLISMFLDACVVCGRHGCCESKVQLPCQWAIVLLKTTEAIIKGRFAGLT